MPIANTVRWSSELPLSRFKRAKTPLELDMREQSLASGLEMPGAGRFEPNRNKTIMAPVNSSFLRRSGVRNARTNTLSTGGALRWLVTPLECRPASPGSRGAPHLATQKRLAGGLALD